MLIQGNTVFENAVYNAKMFVLTKSWGKINNVQTEKSFQGGFGNVACLGDKTWKQSLNSLLFQFSKLYTSFAYQIILSTYLG